MASEKGTGGESVEIELGTAPAGHWLFKDRELLMGPVPAKVLVDKLYAGEIGPDTPVADESDDERWSPLREVAAFAVHVPRAEARRRVMRDKETQEVAAKRRAVSRVAVLAGAALVLVAAVFGVVVWLVSTQPWAEEDEALAELQITVNPPVIALASAEDLAREDETFLDVDVDAPPEAAAQPRRRATRRAAARQPAPQKQQAQAAPAPAAAGAGGTPPAAKTTTQDADGLGTTRSYDMNQIRAVLDRESRSLFPCIRDEVRRSGYSGNIPFAFVINNDGRVGRLWIDERRLRGGEMQQCFEQIMTRWRFPSFPGERPTVNHSFTVGG